MRYGYSNLLGETIEAARLDYSDYRAFQIVCPACREPVFKVVREVMPEPLHYLSHYAAAASYAAECELRVGRLDARDIEQQNLVSRGQKLELFLRLLRDTVKRHEYRNTDAQLKKLFWLLEKSTAICLLRELVCSRLPVFDEKTFQASAEHYINEDVGAQHPMWQTGFAIDTQRRIAYDIWRSLCSHAGRANLQWLWLHGYSTVLSRLQKAEDAGISIPPSRKLRSYAERLVRVRGKEGRLLIVEMLSTEAPKPFAIGGTSYLDKLASEVTHEMIGCLLRLPYFSVLEKSMKKAGSS